MGAKVRKLSPAGLSLSPRLAIFNPGTAETHFQVLTPLCTDYYPRMKFHSPDARYQMVMTSPLREILCSFLLLLVQTAFAQKAQQSNLVPNPGFELFSDKPAGWYYSGKDFSRIALYWTSPNDSSPDLSAESLAVTIRNPLVSLP